ncbi:MAG: hypothetical protein IPM54_32145 [Polyangiaceae bacterium]|nr:hypothetical protein [Polyangiaceae bacterium]
MSSRRRSLRVRTTTTTIGTSALIALGSVGCNRSSAPAPFASTDVSITQPAVSPGQTSASPAASAAPDPDEASVAKALEPYVVTLPNIARRTLYTWTTRAQIEALEKDRVLLTRSESPEHGASFYDQVLDQRAKTNDPLAKVLRTQAFARARFAWPAPFATRLGIGGESYGDELIQVVLKPDAWFVILRISSNDMLVVDANNQPVAMANALAHPERIAAVYFVQDKPATGYRLSMAGPNERLAYREYVICNESMVASYSVGTKEIAAELEAEANALEQYSKHLEMYPIRDEHWQKWMVRLATNVWTKPPNLRFTSQVYEAALAFADSPYLPLTTTLDALVDDLRERRMYDKPFTHVPTATFPRPATLVPSPPPRVVKPKWNGTF